MMRHSRMSLASLPVLHWLRSKPGASTPWVSYWLAAALREHRAGVDAEEQRDDDDEQTADAAADGDAAPPPPPPPPLRRRGAGVDLHALVEGHPRSFRSPSTTCRHPPEGWAPAAFSFPHYDSGVAAQRETAEHLDRRAHRRTGRLRGTTEGGVNVWRGVAYAEQPVGERRFLRARAAGAVDGRARRRRARPAAAAGPVVRRRRPRRSEDPRRGVPDGDGVVARRHRARCR